MITLSIWQTDTSFLLKNENFSCVLQEQPWKSKKIWLVFMEIQTITPTGNILM